MNKVQAMNRTARSTGAVGKSAVVPRYVADMAKPGDSILDFGAGPKAIHTEQLNSQGLIVTAYEIGDNFVPGIHNECALNWMYDIVYASNVLNVQFSLWDIRDCINKMHKVLQPGGLIIWNYPASPRKSNTPVFQILETFANLGYVTTESRKLSRTVVYISKKKS